MHNFPVNREMNLLNLVTSSLAHVGVVMTNCELIRLYKIRLAIYNQTMQLVFIFVYI